MTDKTWCGCLKGDVHYWEKLLHCDTKYVASTWTLLIGYAFKLQMSQFTQVLVIGEKNQCNKTYLGLMFSDK